MRHARTITVALALTCLSLALAGCVSVTRTIYTRGAIAGPEALLGVKAGETTRADIVKMFGPPSWTETKGDIEVLKYLTRSREACRTRYLFVYSSGSRISTSAEYAFEIRGGVVQSVKRTDM